MISRKLIFVEVSTTVINVLKRDLGDLRAITFSLGAGIAHRKLETEKIRKDFITAMKNFIFV